MKANFMMRVALLFAAFALLYSVPSCTGTPEEATEENATTTNCQDSLQWLSQNPIPEPDYANFPCGYSADTDGSATNQSFHQISWQYFLWLTEEITVNGTTMLRCESMFNDASINLSATDPKAKTHILGGIQQAGGSNSVLIDNNGRAVYTTMMINDIYRDFVVQNKLNTVDGMNNVDPNLDFPNGAMSLKAAWKIVKDDNDIPKGAYTRDAELYTVVNGPSGTVTTSDTYTDPSKHKTIKERVALVGLHIAVVVEGHPEFIWATFEHNDNAPSYFLQGETDPTGVPSTKDHTFYAANTEEPLCNVSMTGSLRVNETTQVISAAYGQSTTTQVYRRYEYGEGRVSNQGNIARMNSTAKSSLPSNTFAQRYHEVGAIWFNQPNILKPNWSPTVDNSIMTGSLRLSSSVIETFTQDPNAQDNCFACHNTSRFNQGTVTLQGKNVLTSHILLKNYSNALLENKERKVLVERD